jgi:hypothetical protein
MQRAYMNFYLQPERDAMAPKTSPFDSSQVIYNDLVVMNFTRDPENGFPIKSFHCHQDKQQMTEVIEIAKAFLQDTKIQAMRRGDEIPDLRLGRVCAQKGTQNSVVDYQFQTHKLGITPTPDPEKEDASVLSGALAGIAKDNPL